MNFDKDELETFEDIKEELEFIRLFYCKGDDEHVILNVLIDMIGGILRKGVDGEI